MMELKQLSNILNVQNSYINSLILQKYTKPCLFINRILDQLKTKLWMVKNK